MVVTFCFASGKCRYLTARIWNGNGRHPRQYGGAKGHTVFGSCSSDHATRYLSKSFCHVEDDVLQVQLNCS